MFLLILPTLYCLLFISILYIFLLLILHTHLHIFYILYLFITILNFTNLFFYLLPNHSIYLLILTYRLHSILNLLLTAIFFFPLFYNSSHNKLIMFRIHIISNTLLLSLHILSYLPYFIHFVPSIINFKIFHLVYNFFFYLLNIPLISLLLQIPHSPQNNPCLNMANIVCLIRSFFIIYNIFFLNHIHIHIFLL